MSIPQSLLQHITDVRRDLHAHPEIAYEERRTSEVVSRELKDAGIEHLSEESDVKLAKFQDRFRLDLSDEDAERFFLSLINESLNALVPVVLEKFHKIAVWMK